MNLYAIQYTTQLSFEDVLEFIPMLTIDNDVVTDNKITHLKLYINEEKVNVFYDEATKHYCLDNCSEDISEYANRIGEFIQAYCLTVSSDLESLSKKLLEVF
jgi:hypothetical protein